MFSEAVFRPNRTVKFFGRSSVNAKCNIVTFSVVGADSRASHIRVPFSCIYSNAVFPIHSGSMCLLLLRRNSVRFNKNPAPNRNQFKHYFSERCDIATYRLMCVCVGACVCVRVCPTIYYYYLSSSMYMYVFRNFALHDGVSARKFFGAWASRMNCIWNKSFDFWNRCMRIDSNWWLFDVGSVRSVVMVACFYLLLSFAKRANRPRPTIAHRISATTIERHTCCAVSREPGACLKSQKHKKHTKQNKNFGRTIYGISRLAFACKFACDIGRETSNWWKCIFILI